VRLGVFRATITSCPELINTLLVDHARDLHIVGQTLFGSELGEDGAVVSAAVEEGMRCVIDSMTGLVPLPSAIRTPANLRLRRDPPVGPRRRPRDPRARQPSAAEPRPKLSVGE
jgi:hypothetical protein